MTNDTEPINLISDDEEDEDLKRAIALSLEEAPEDVLVNTNSNAVFSKPDKLEQNSSQKSHEINAAKPGILGLDRKQMELDRLARLKRKRGQDSNPTTQPQRTVSPPPLRRTTQTSLPRHQPATQSQVHTATTNMSATPFLDGLTLLTADSTRRSKASNQLESISFAEAVRAPPGFVLRSCLLSSFIIDFDWLLPHFDTKSTSFVLCLHAPTPQHRDTLEKDFAGIANVRLVFPKLLGGAGTMHSKLMLLFYKSLGNGVASSVCRVVVPSANLVPHDWGVGRIIENVLYIVDLPAHDPSETGQKGDAPEFKSALVAQLKAFGVTKELIAKLDVYDFTRTKHLRLVHSCAGSHAIQDISQTMLRARNVGNEMTGLLGLSEAITSLGLCLEPDDASYPPQIDFIASSLGNLSSKFLSNLFLTICGGLATRSSPTDLNKRDVSAYKLDEVLRPCLSVYFPSDTTVRHSHGGADGARTICFQRKWWEAEGTDFPKGCLRDCVGARGDGILQHSKILYVRFRQAKTVHLSHGDRKTYAGWAYIGSANLSESAWGAVSAKTHSRPAKITCRNWETGILIPVEQRMAQTRSSDPLKDSMQNDVHTTSRRLDPEQTRGNSTARTSRSISTKQPGEHYTRADANHTGQGSSSDGTSIGLPSLVEVFGGAVPIPIVFPAPSLTESGREPWFFNS